MKWKLGSVSFEIVLILMQDRCTVCMVHTICNLASVHLETMLVSVQDRCMVCV